MSEVNVINKQKFLAELAKLLTFMYEDDRQSALRAYADMFDEAADEQALIQALNSPLRQAVEVARAYNAGTPALGTPSRGAKDEDDGAFLEAIAAIRDYALSLQPVPQAAAVPVVEEEEVPVNDNQISLFDEAQTPMAAPDDVAAEQAPLFADAADSFAAAFLDEDVAKKLLDLPDEAPEAVETVEDPQPAPQAMDEEEAEEEDVSMFDDEEEEAGEEEFLPVQKTVRKARIFLLIPYIIFAVPITLLLLLLLLLPALASLAAAAGCVIAAVLAVLSSIGTFPKIANLLVALGAAVIVFALGILFLMLSIWLFGGAMGGLVRGVIALGGKWCYKEVDAE